MNLLRRRGLSWLTAYLFLLPALAILMVFHFYPMFDSLHLSFYKYNIIQPPKFIGFLNYQQLFQDKSLIRAVGNTLLYAAVVMPALVIWPLLLALAVNRPLRGMGFFRVSVYIPVITAMVVVALLWKWMYLPEGMINNLGRSLHLIREPKNFLSEELLALPAVMVVTIWKAAGYYMVIYLAGLQSIPKELEEAAAIDGANALQRIWHVVVPLLRPTMAIVAIMAFIGTMQAFDEIYLMTSGGPGDATRTVVFYIYNKAFQQLDVGYSAAISMLLFLFVLGISLIMNRFFERGGVRS